MSAISTYLNNIRTAIYGREVQTSIVNAIEQCYSDVNSPELRVGAFETAVQNKINNGTLQNMTIPDGSLSPAKLNFSAAENLTAAQKAEIIGLLDDDAPTPT